MSEKDLLDLLRLVGAVEVDAGTVSGSLRGWMLSRRMGKTLLLSFKPNKVLRRFRSPPVSPEAERRLYSVHTTTFTIKK